MITIRCPYCRELRTEEELIYGGEADVMRPAETSSDQQWTDYLFMRTNPKGVHHEQWCCSAGCSQWFKVVRDTVSHEILHVRKFEELQQPAAEVV